MEWIASRGFGCVSYVRIDRQSITNVLSDLTIYWHTQATVHIDSRDTCIYEVNLANKHSLGVAGRENGADA